MFTLKRISGNTAKLLVWVFMLLLSCDKDDAPVVSFAEITINGVKERYTISNAEYSYVQKQFKVSLEGQNTTFSFAIPVENPEQLLPANLNTPCEAFITVETSRLAGIAQESVLSISSIDRRGRLYVIKGAGENIKFNQLTAGELVIEKLDFSIPFSIPDKSKLDFVSFKAGGKTYEYYGDKGSGYYPDLFSPDDKFLLLTANVGDIGYNPIQPAFLAEGVTVIDNAPVYPPVPHSHEMQLYVNTGKENDSCFPFILDSYRNTSANITITNVKNIPDGFELIGTFDGTAANIEDDEDVITITDGTFKVTVPAL